MCISIESYRQRIGLYRNSGQFHFKTDLAHGNYPRLSVKYLILWIFLLSSNFTCERFVKPNTALEYSNISTNCFRSVRSGAIATPSIV